MKSYFKEISIILGYLVLLIGMIFFEWSIIWIFVSLVVEYFAFLFFYTFLIAKFDKEKNQGQTTSSILWVGGFLGFIQGSLIILIGTTIDEEFKIGSADLSWYTVLVFLFIPAFAINFLSILNKSINQHYLNQQRNKFFLLAFVLSATAGLGFLVSQFFSVDNTTPTLLSIFIVRAISEIWMHRFQQ